MGNWIERGAQRRPAQPAAPRAIGAQERGAIHALNAALGDVSMDYQNARQAVFSTHAPLVRAAQAADAAAASVADRSARRANRKKTKRR